MDQILSENSNRLNNFNFINEEEEITLPDFSTLKIFPKYKNSEFESFEKKEDNSFKIFEELQKEINNKNELNLIKENSNSLRKKSGLIAVEKKSFTKKRKIEKNNFKFTFSKAKNKKFKRNLTVNIPSDAEITKINVPFIPRIYKKKIHKLQYKKHNIFIEIPLITSDEEKEEVLITLEKNSSLLKNNCSNEVKILKSESNKIYFLFKRANIFIKNPLLFL